MKQTLEKSRESVHMAKVAKTTKPYTILLVEDERTLNEAYQTMLKYAGYKVVSAYDGEEALDIAGGTQPDLILLDLRMPRMGGLDFLKKYDLAHKHPDVKVIVFSNLDTQSDIDEAYRLGADRYILKAWASPRELLQLVNEVLHNTQSGSDLKAF